MTVWLSKLWLYGGWFYLSLILAVLLVHLTSLKPKQVLKLIICLALGLSGFIYALNLRQLPETLKQLTLLYNQRVAAITFSQVPFVEKIDKVLSPKASGCLIASWDVPTHFVKQRLYPRRFEIVEETDELAACEYVISQYQVREVAGFTPLIVVKENVLYRRQ